MSIESWSPPGKRSLKRHTQGRHVNANCSGLLAGGGEVFNSLDEKELVGNWQGER